MGLSYYRLTEVTGRTVCFALLWLNVNRLRKNNPVLSASASNIQSDSEVYTS